VIPLIAVPGRLRDDIRGARGGAVLSGRRYLDALTRAGAAPAILDPSAPVDVATVLARFDGLLLLGGGDVDPARYGAEDVHPEVGGIDEHHDAFELAALRAALDVDLPVLAVCRGCQVLNVALGGTLRQHVDDHRGVLHSVAVVPGSRTEAAMGTSGPTGWSRHHQVIERVGAGLVVTARDADGLVEGVELPDRWVVGVQWHPEDSAAEDPAQQGLFDAFVAECRARSRTCRESAPNSRRSADRSG
jgi:putative glutamine amidotransferase